MSRPVAIDVCPAAPSSWRPGEPIADAEVTVVVGDTLAALVPVPATVGGSFNSPDCGRGTQDARTAFIAHAGQTYSIIVTAYGEPIRPTVRLRIGASGFVGMRQVFRNGAPQARLVYRAYPGRKDDASVVLEWPPTGSPVPPRPLPPPIALSLSADEVAVGGGCGYPNAPFGPARCPIPQGTKLAGPDIKLGDRDDGAYVGYSRADTVLRGGPGNDRISSSGRLLGGTGNDRIEARRWVPSHIRGGPGNDLIRGSSRHDTVDPGSGLDYVDLRGVRTGGAPGEQVDTRDGEIDFLRCYAEDTADIDAVDTYPDGCGTVRRHGGPGRAVPLGHAPFFFRPHPTEGGGDVDVQCPLDGPRTCTGTVTLSRGSRILVRKRFRCRRPRGFSEICAAGYRVSGSEARMMRGGVTITVRSQDRAGKPRTATATVRRPPLYAVLFP